jgi:hypothetical protein
MHALRNDIFYQKNKKTKRADQILPEVYGTTLTNLYRKCAILTDE